MHDVFISYSSKNDEYAHTICHQLEEEGITCWYAPRDIIAGEPWASAIVRAIGEAKVFVLVFSEQSNFSKQVLREVTLAANKNCHIIPFRIDNTNMEGDMEYYLQSLHWMDAHSRSLEDAISEMADRIKSIVGKDGVQPSSESGKEKEPEIPVDSLDDDVDADDIVEEESENCDLLDVNADFEPSEEKDRIEEQIESDDEDDEDDEDDNKIITIFKKIIDWLIIVVGTLSIVFLVWEYAYPPIQKWMDRDKMQFSKISEFSHYKYPFYSVSMFTHGMDLMFCKDTDTDKLVLVKTDTCYPVVTDIDYKYDFASDVECYAKEESDIVYFLDMNKDIVKIYDRGRKKWINSKGIKLDISVTEYVSQVLFSKSTLNLSKDLTDDILMFVYDYREGVPYYSKVINMKSDGTYTTVDISQHKLVSVIGVTKPGTALMWTEDEQIKILDFRHGTVPDLTHEQIVKKYVPSLSAGSSVLSPNKKYVCRQKTTADALSVVVWELESGKKVFSSSFERNSSAYFSSDNKLVCYNRENCRLIEYTFGKEKKHKVIFDKEYFIDNDEFIEFPHTFFYSAELDKYFFCCAKEAKNGQYKDKLIMVDRKGKIVAQSEEFEIPGVSSLPEIVIDEDKIFYIYNITGNKKTKDSTYSIIYRTMFSKNEDGTYTFE